MPPRPIRSIGTPEDRGPKGHRFTGTVASVGDDYSRPDTHTRIEVQHGKPKKSKGKGAMPFPDGSRSSFSIPKKYAKHYPHGQKVAMSIRPTDDDPAGDDQDLDANPDND